MAYEARCDAIPGSYTEKSPGVCWEVGTEGRCLTGRRNLFLPKVGLPWRPPTYPDFDGQAIREEIWRSVCLAQFQWNVFGILN